MSVSIIVAVSKNGVIGCKGRIPWRLPYDLKRFSKLTEGATVIMGKNTWKSLPDSFRPLPKRKNVVISNSSEFHLEKEEGGLLTLVRPGAQNLSEIVSREKGDVFLIGGERIYREGISFADRLLVTVVDCVIEGDAHFPEALNPPSQTWWLVAKSIDPVPPTGQPTSEFFWYHRVIKPSSH